jgi:hypothetical protein
MGICTHLAAKRHAQIRPECTVAAAPPPAEVVHPDAHIYALCHMTTPQLTPLRGRSDMPALLSGLAVQTYCGNLIAPRRAGAPRVTLRKSFSLTYKQPSTYSVPTNRFAWCFSGNFLPQPKFHPVQLSAALTTVPDTSHPLWASAKLRHLG